MYECQEIIFKRKTFFLNNHTLDLSRYVCFSMYKNKQHAFVTPTEATKS